VRVTAAHIAQIDAAAGPAARLTGRGEPTAATVPAKAVAVVLHGGREVSMAPVAGRQLAVVRMLPIARALEHAGDAFGLAVWRLQFRYRGWNGDAAHPLEDLDWALRRLESMHGDAPVVLVGHSMGGRAALRAAAARTVAGVVALAPWIPAGEPRAPLRDRRLLVVHGVRDRITSPQASRHFVDDVRPIARETTYVALRGTGHALLRRGGLCNELLAGFVLHAALGIEPRGALAGAIEGGDVVL
jgi:predicted esterase